mgnify:FL=1
MKNGNWYKYEGNPVMGGKETGTCYDVDVRFEDGLYKMNFTWRPHRSIAQTESPDGIHWSPFETLLSPRLDSGWEDAVSRSCIIRHNGEYWMWYSGMARGYARIGLAKSHDGHHFERLSMEPVLIPELPWENNTVYNPFVLFDEKRAVFRMWYAGGEIYEPNAIGYAESPDGVHWRKFPANPIFIKGDSPCEQTRIGACEVIPDDKYGFLMFYIGYFDIDTASICIAHSPDGVTRWTRFHGNPIVEPAALSLPKEERLALRPGGTGLPGSPWDAAACYKPSVVKDLKNKRWLLWYNGRNCRDEYIGLAIHDGLDLEL